MLFVLYSAVLQKLLTKTRARFLYNAQYLPANVQRASLRAFYAFAK